MSNLILKYQDSSGVVSERCISAIEVEDGQTINAYCHLRQGRRSFKLSRIVRLIDPESGEVINPYLHFGSPASPSGRPSLEALTWYAISAIKALKFFSLSTRGFRQRERELLFRFAQEVVDLSLYSKEEVNEWIYKLWCGDLYRYRNGDTVEYAETLRNLPPLMLNRCRDYALQIAGGSGRKPIDPSWVDRIESEFCPDPIVRSPAKVTSNAVITTISVNTADFID